jgi:hypothetical protein
MFECMRERRNKRMVRKIEKIYVRKKKTKRRVIEKEGEWFETIKGVRQGCPLLFTIYVADMDEMLKKA